MVLCFLTPNFFHEAEQTDFLKLFICNYSLTNVALDHVCAIFFVFFLRSSLLSRGLGKASTLSNRDSDRQRSEFPDTNITHFA
jgi:hypothetical protein